MKQRKIAAVFAHPDDETFICGGTLAKYAKEGSELTLICATKGDMGRRMGKPPFVNRETMPLLREQELNNACRHLGIAHLQFLGIRDKLVEFEDFSALVGRIVMQFRRLQPDVVLTFHEIWGGHPDHCAIGKAATAAFYAAQDSDAYPEQLQAGLNVYEPGKLYFISFGDALKDPQRFGLTRDQITVVDVMETRKEKMLAFRDHRSQSELNEWLWGADQAVIQNFGRSEYFIQGYPTSRAGETDLFA